MFARINGVQLFFDVISEGIAMGSLPPRQKLPLFALHGGPGMEHGGIKSAVLPLTNEFQVVLYDQRGSGLSQRVPQKALSMEAFVEDLEALRKYLGFKKIVLLGISFGGMLALEYAWRYQPRLAALILVVTAPSYRFKMDARRIVEKLSLRYRQAAYKILDGNIRSNHELRHTLAVLAPLYARHGRFATTWRSLQNTPLNYRVLRWFFKDACYDYDVVAHLPKIKVPTLIIGAERDWICPLPHSQLLQAKIKNADLVVVKNGHHLCFEEDNDKFIRAIYKFAKAHNLISGKQG